jgi:lysine 2,3-aminomutase
MQPDNASAESKRFDDWLWQYSNRITDTKQLSDYLKLSKKETEEIDSCLKKFRMAVTPYYAQLINPDDPLDPIRLQAIPRIEEMNNCINDMADPLNEQGDSPVKGIVHRYPDRVLLLVTYCCAMYCRHCTRRRVVGTTDNTISRHDFQKALEYIKQNPQVRDVLISGGDPLVLDTDTLEWLISSIRSIKTVEIIRIGTRVPVVMPMRIDSQLLNMFKRYQPIWINTHFNHPKEITDKSRRACEAIVDAGIPLGNQSVLLREVNDNANTMSRLLTELVKMRVRPYYLYQCDLSQGISHFRTRVDTGIEIMRALQGNIPGYCIPKYVIDAPNGAGKIPIGYNYVKQFDNNKVIMENYKGETCSYPQPVR